MVDLDSYFDMATRLLHANKTYKNLEGLMPSKKNYLLDHRIIEMT